MSTRFISVVGLLIVLNTAFAQSPPPASFSAATNYGAGSAPISVAVGDFNGDGNPDLVVANFGGAVSVLLGNGDGTFQTAVNYNAGSAPISVAVGDFNGDGKLDLAVANQSSSNVSVLLGNGDGTFQAAVNYGTGSGSYSVAVADFNGDGKPDLAVANQGSSNVSVLLGNGDGTFQMAVNYGTGSGPYSVAVADFNGDGKPDLAVADQGSNNVSVLLGNGDGTFQAAVNYGAGTNPVSVAVGDLNGDGKPDLAIANQGSNNVSVLLGNGDGTFQAAVNYAAAGSDPVSVAVADFNGDGKPDLAMASLDGVSVLLGNGDGTFQAAVNYAAGTNPSAVAVGDFNGDGKPDLAVANEGDNDVSILLNTTAYPGPAIIESPAPNSTLPGSSVTFQWTPSDPATAYWINVGSSVGGDEYYQSGSLGTSTRSAAVSGLPTNGSTVYVTMYSLIGGLWVSNTYAYAAYNVAMHLGVMTSPAANSTLTGSSVTFQWNAGSSATAYWVDIGSTAGGNNYYSSGNLGNVLTTTANGLPTNGSTVYVTLYSLVGTVWTPNAYTYTAFNMAGAGGVLTTPTPSSTLTSSSVAFTWTAGSGATAYWVDIGSTTGSNNYYSSGNLGNVLTTTVSGLPTNGCTVYVTLYSMVSGAWLSNGYTYTAFNVAGAGGVMQTPTPSSTLTGGSVALTWTAGSGAMAYWVDIGSAAGGNNYYSSGNLGNVLTTTANGLPTNGSTVYVTLYSMVSGQWLSNGYTYTAFNLAAAGGVLTTPTPSSILTGSSVAFTWAAGSGATAYWVDIGSTAGGNNYYSSGNLGNVLTTTVNTLPTNGSTVYVTLYSMVSGAWLSNAYTYTAFNVATAAGGVLTTPVPGSTLTSGTVTFDWTVGSGATAYWVDIGSTAGGNNYYSSGNLGNVLTTTVSGLPTNGSTVYVTLYSLVGGQWLSNAYTYSTLITYPGSTFFVAPNGNDSWSGSLSAPNANNSDGPFASLSRAQYAVEKAAKPATVIVRNGTYYLALTPSATNSYSGSLTFTSADSGVSSSAQVTWQNYPGEMPVISGGVPANADPISGVGLNLQWTNSGNWYQALLPATLSNNVALQPFESLYYNGQRRLRSRIHDNGTSQYPSIGYFMKNGQCVASPSTPAGQQTPTLASCNLGTFLRVTNTIAPTAALGQGCPYASGTVNNVTVSKCLDRFIYTNTSGGDPIQAWQNLNGSYSGIPANPCTPNANSYPAGDVELTLIDAWTTDIMRISCVDTADNVIFLLGPTKGGGTQANTNYNFLGPTVGHRYMIENTLDAFNDALTPTSSEYGITGIWFLDRHTTPWVLNYIANQNESPNTDNIVIPQLGGAIPGAPATDYIGGSLISATNLNYVTFQGITFEVDDFYPNSVGFNNDVNGEMPVPQAIDCENCQFVTFNTVTVRHTSASGILAAATAATPACSGSAPPSCVVVENSTLYDIGDSGIRIGHTVGVADTTATVVQDVMVQNNLIQGYSRVFPDGEGIGEGNGNNNQYSYNTITDGYHAGISICQNGCGPTTKAGVSVSGNNILSSYNLISNVIQGITSDGGALFYNIGNGGSSGTGSSIASNVVNNVTDSYIIDNPITAGVTVAGSAYGGEGIYLDGQTAGVEVSNNVVYNLSGHAIDLSEGLASSSETQNTFNNNIFAFANLGMFIQEVPWPKGCPSSPIKQVDVTNNVFYFDRFSTSTPTFYVVEGCSDSCHQAYNTYQNFQGNTYWRTDGQFAADSSAFQVLTTQGLTSSNSCRTGPTTPLYFSSQTAPDWQTGGTGVPVAMNEDLQPNATATYQPPFTGTGLTSDPPGDYSLPTGQAPPTPFVLGNTNLTITNAHSSLSQLGSVPATFPTYVYGNALNKF